MKIIDTSAVNTNSWMPLLGNYFDAVHSTYNSFVVNGSTSNYLAGIDFIQQAYTECLNAIAKFAIADTTKVTILYGCQFSYIPPYYTEVHEYYDEESSDKYWISPGWIYYQGELYYVQGLIWGTYTHPYVNATITTSYSAADPAIFSDTGGSHNIHMLRTIVLANSSTPHTTGDGDIIPDYGNWKNAGNNSNAQTAVTNTINNWITNTWNTFNTNYLALTTPAITRVGTSGNPMFETVWSNTGLGDTVNVLSYYKVFNRVYLWGEIMNATHSLKSSVIFHLPPECHPISTEEIFAVPDITNANYPDGGNNVGATYYIWVQSDGSVTFLGNTPSESGCKISLSGINFLAGVYVEPVINYQ